MVVEKLIKYLKTPAGCDGGNIDGSNWLFSIEYGGDAQLTDYENLVVDDSHGFVPDSDVAKFSNDCRFNQNLAKFEAVRHGWDISEYSKFAEKEEMFTRSSEYYKGNVGALQFKHDNQESYSDVGTILGIQSKEELKTLEIEHRAPMFQKWVRDHVPSFVCCFGTSDIRRFIKAFSDSNEKSSSWRKLEGYYYYHDVVNSGRTNLFVLPHLTAQFGNGLTNDSRIEEYAKMVRNTIIRNGFRII